MIKQPGGILVPMSDIDGEKLTRFQTNEVYEIDIKLQRNPGFHRKVFKFLHFCFDYWKGNEQVKFMDEPAQFDVFRDHLTVLAGYYKQHYGIDGRVRVEAESLSYASMSQERFEQFYTAIVNAAMRHIFNTNDQAVYDKLIGFF